MVNKYVKTIRVYTQGKLPCYYKWTKVSDNNKWIYAMPVNKNKSFNP